MICKEINEKTSLSLSYQTIKEGRFIKQIRFEFWEKGKARSYPTLPPSKSAFKKLNIEDLSFAQLKAFQLLTRYGVKIQLALDMIAKVQGSEIIGFQDWYFEEVLKIFESKTNQTTAAAKTGTLVNWFLKKRIFEQGDHFAVIMERLQGRKKQLQQKNEVAWANRLVAKEITAEAYRKMAQP